jgi:Aspartyl/Asparaginyl beta-hydroxylase
MQHLRTVVEQMRAGGYYDRVMAGGPELDRMKDFLRACAGAPTVPPRDPLQRPHYPCFPGLRNRPWHDPREIEAVRILESRFAQIREEASRLGADARIDYSAAARPWRSWTRPWTLLRPDPAPGTWTVYLLHHMGVNVEPVMGRCPRTLAIVDSLPGACTEYAWGDFIFSAMGPGAHLRPHCSIDNLRVRIHLGITIPGHCSMRVGTETRGWSEGKCLVFEDSFEHEVWNRSQSRRVVLIADLWHPDLTDIEVRALTAAFRKSEVRRAFLRERIGITDAPEKYLPFIEDALARQDADPVVREFWPG